MWRVSRLQKEKGPNMTLHLWCVKKSPTIEENVELLLCFIIIYYLLPLTLSTFFSRLLFLPL